jgi:hypothetical protein
VEAVKPSETVMTWGSPAPKIVPTTLGHMRRVIPGLVSACVADFSRLHTVLRHADQVPITDPPKVTKPVKPQCIDADGVCLCGEAGDILFSFKLWFCKQLSNAFRSTEELKSVFNNGDLVIRLQSSLDDDASDIDADDDRVEADMWFHVSLMYFTPVKPWLRELEWIDREVDMHGNIVLHALHKYYTMWQMLKYVYVADSCWDLRYYTLVEADLPIITVDPTKVRVQHRLVEVMKHRAVKKRGAKRSKEKDDALLEALVHMPLKTPSDDGSDHGSEGSAHGDGPVDDDDAGGNTSKEGSSSRGDGSVRGPGTPEPGGGSEAGTADLFISDPDGSGDDGRVFGITDSSSDDETSDQANVSYHLVDLPKHVVFLFVLAVITIRSVSIHVILFLMTFFFYDKYNRM